MNRTSRVFSICFAAILLIALPALSFEYPLSDTAIREAFLTGNANNGHSTELFVTYAHNFSAPESGPYVSVIRLKTPYEQVAQRGATASNYHAEEAEKEFLGKPLPLIVAVQIQFTPTYPDYNQNFGAAYSLLQPLPDYLHDFQIDVSQDSTITPEASRAYLTSSYFSNTIWGISGLVIEQQYDPKQIDSSELTVEVHTPDGQDVATTFDMSQIK